MIITWKITVNKLCDKRWNYANIDLIKGRTGTCCLPPTIKITNQDINDYGLDVFVNHPYLKKRRLEMFKNLQHPDCKTCWNLEQAGATSMRGNSDTNYLNNVYSAYKTDNNLSTICNEIEENSEYLESKEIDLLEISIGSTCDLKCVYCSKNCSSQWALEDFANNNITKEEFKSLTRKDVDPAIDKVFWEWYNDFAKFNVKHINIKGGEPLVIPYFYEIMEKLIMYSNDSADFDVTIITNLNTSNEARINLFFDYLAQLQKTRLVHVYVSMESLYEKAEYIRNGLQWENFEKNLRNLIVLSRQNSNINVAFMPTINLLSITSLPKFVIWIKELQEQYHGLLTAKCNMADNEFSPLNLTYHFAKYTQEALDTIKFMRDKRFPGQWDWQNFYKHIEGIHNVIESNINLDAINTKSIKKLINLLEKIDKNRHTDYKVTFKDYLKFFDKVQAI